MLRPTYSSLWLSYPGIFLQCNLLSYFHLEVVKTHLKNLTRSNNLHTISHTDFHWTGNEHWITKPVALIVEAILIDEQSFDLAKFFYGRPSTALLSLRIYLKPRFLHFFTLVSFCNFELHQQSGQESLEGVLYFHHSRWARAFSIFPPYNRILEPHVRGAQVIWIGAWTESVHWDAMAFILAIASWIWVLI